MESWQKAVLAVLAVLVFGMATFTVGYSIGTGDGVRIFGGGSDSSGSELIEDAYEQIIGSSVDPPSERELVRGAIRGMVKVLKKSEDPYALFYGREGYRSFKELTRGDFSGIGVWLDTDDTTVEITKVLPDSPALKAGMKEGDVVVAVNGKSVKGVSPNGVVRRIKGPEGTKVTIGVRRDGERVELQMRRQSIELPNLTSHITEDGAGYIRLFGFARGAARHLRDKVSEYVETEGVNGIVLDLCDNPGGLFDEAINVASVFIEEGEVVIYEEGDGNRTSYDAKGNAYEDVPLVVLVNGGSASAAEIVAGAFKDRDRATIVGTTTYGKASVQEVFSLEDTVALKLTTAAYLTPDGTNINGRGIEPDIRVGDSPRAQRQRALEVLEGIAVSSAGSQG